MRKLFPRGATVAVAAITALFTGSTGLAYAGVNVSTMGPSSPVSISEQTNINCTVHNNNNVSSINTANQEATTGNVNVSGNTSAGGWSSSWGSWDPSVWAAQGHTYSEWAAAFNAHMGEIQANWGALGSNGGGASSGNATNNSSISTNVVIANNAGCGATGSVGGTNISTQGPNSGVSALLGANTTKSTVNNNNVSGVSTTKQAAKTGKVNVSGNTSAGGSGSGSAGNGNASGSSFGIRNLGDPSDPAVLGASIGIGGTSTNVTTMGPNSPVNLSTTSNNNTNLVNNNNILNISTTNQEAKTGSSNVSGNTSAGGSGSGSAGNSNGGTSTIIVTN